jgi:hypothetical protein
VARRESGAFHARTGLTDLIDLIDLIERVASGKRRCGAGNPR